MTEEKIIIKVKGKVEELLKDEEWGEIYANYGKIGIWETSHIKISIKNMDVSGLEEGDVVEIVIKKVTS